MRKLFRLLLSTKVIQLVGTTQASLVIGASIALAQACPQAQLIGEGNNRYLEISFPTAKGSLIALQVRDSAEQSVRSLSFKVTEPSTASSLETLPILIPGSSYYKADWKRAVWNPEVREISEEAHLFSVGVFKLSSSFDALNLVTVFLPSAADSLSGLGASFEYVFSADGTIEAVNSHCGPVSLEELLPPEDYLVDLNLLETAPELTGTASVSGGALAYRGGHAVCETPDNRIALLASGEEGCFEIAAPAGAPRPSSEPVDLDESIESNLKAISALLYIAKRGLPLRSNIRKFGVHKRKKIQNRRRAILKARAQLERHLGVLMKAVVSSEATDLNSLGFSKNDFDDLESLFEKASRQSLSGSDQKRQAWTDFESIIGKLLEQTRR